MIAAFFIASSRPRDFGGEGGARVGVYSGALTREQFIFREMRIVTRLYKQGLPEAEIMERVFRENLFQYPTEREIKGKCKTALKRLRRIAGSGYDRKAAYALVLRDEEEKAPLARIPFQIDIVFGNDFDF